MQPSSVPEPSRPQRAAAAPLTQASVLRHRARPGLLGALAAGGALGTGARDWISTEVHVTSGTFPWSTFWVNIAGSFVLGVGLILILERLPPGRYLRPFFASGICGGFTTFSTLMVEADLLVHDHRPLIAAAYLAATLTFGLAAAAIGVLWGRALPLELAPLFGHHVKPRPRRRPPA